MRATHILLSCIVLAPSSACGHGCGGGASTGFDELRISAENGHRGSPMSLSIDGTGRANLFVGGPTALPTVEARHVGYFTTQLTETERRELEALARAAEIEDLDDPPGPLPSGDYATLVFALEGERHSHIVGQERSDELEQLLDRLSELAGRLLDHPERAVRAEVEARVSADGRLLPQLVLQHVGSAPLSVLLFDPEVVGNYLRVDLSTRAPDAAEPVGQRIPRDSIVALAVSGRLPRGVDSLGVGERYVVSLDEITVSPGTSVEGEVGFWLAGPGPARRAVRLRFGPTELIPSNSDRSR